MAQTPEPTLDARRAYHGHGYRNELSGWIRVMLGALLLIAAVAVVGFALGWRNVDELVIPAEPASSQTQ